MDYAHVSQNVTRVSET